ncbi:MAG: hypothetical protein MUF45_16905 [Spirosomaceae bacterium]|jgi:hypothetical protein|nr:hypothetical protein [Spirosomataceae bacterium]
MQLHLNYVTDSKGKQLFVQLPVKEFEQIMADLEELEDIKAYKKAKKNQGKLIPIEEAFALIENEI